MVGEKSNSTLVSKLNREAALYLNTATANSARSMNCTDVRTITGVNCNSYKGTPTNELMAVGVYYWLATAYSTNSTDTYNASTYGSIKSSSSSSSFIGLRVVINLKSGLLKYSGSGTTGSPYKIGW